LAGTAAEWYNSEKGQSMAIALDAHLETRPTLRGGKPCLAGTRIAVNDIVLLHLRLGQSLEQIAGHYGLSLAALHAAMMYYYDHQEEIDRQMQEEDALIRQWREQSPSLLRAKLQELHDG
jgi:uncharacterized protein (DUF433 family)